MSHSDTPTPHDGGRGEPHRRQDTVTITVNGQAVSIHRGSQTGLTIRTAAGCPSTYSLQLLPDFTEVGVDGRITLKGGEEFVCHQPVGQAS
ncbi:MAG: hypothetical protein AB1938_29925 [Myxococcota bacterium]